MPYSHGLFITYSTSILIAPLGCILLIILQVISDKYSRSGSSITDKVTHTLLFCVYITGAFCGITGYVLHISNNAKWCEVFGLIPCFAFLGASKAFLYLFFLRRAKLAQGMTMNAKCKRILFTYIAPIYLFLYWLIYCVLTSVFFAGGISNDTISFCVLKKAAIWFCPLAACIDIFNGTSSLLLFLYPLINAINKIKKINAINKIKDDHSEYVSVMKWNIILTFIATLSSVTNLFMLPVAAEYIWAFCLSDPFINALCTFCMIAPNRRLIKRICCCSVNHQNDDENGGSKTRSNVIKLDVVRSASIDEKQKGEPKVNQIQP